MNLTHKTLSVLAGVIALSIALNYVVLQRIVFPTFADLEQAEAQRNLKRSTDAIQNELTHLSRFVWDWAAWDDTDEFIQNQNQKYIESNLVESNFTGSRINVIIFYDNNGHVVWGQIYDLEAEDYIELGEMPSLNLSPDHPLLSKLTVTSAPKGVMLTSRGAILIASRPIVNSDEEGPGRGALVMGLFLTDPVIEALHEQTQVDFQVWPLDERPSSPSEQEALVQLETGKKVVFREAGEDVLAAYSLLLDSANTPALLLRVNTPKSITAAGLDTIKTAVLGLVLAGLVSLLVMAFAIQRVVVGPLLGLTKYVLEIGKSSDLSKRLAVSRGDEIGLLGREFNRMLGQLQEAQHRLSEQSFQVGLAEMASDVLHNVRNQLTPLALRVGRLKQAVTDTSDVSLETALAELADGSTPNDRREKLAKYVKISMQKLTAEKTDAQKQLEWMSQELTDVDALLSEQDDVSRTQHILEEVVLADLFNEAIAMAPKHAGKEIAMRVNGNIDPMTTVLAERFLLKKILTNLLTNAAEANEGSDKEVVDIEAKADIEMVNGREMVHLRVRDNGRGIDADTLKVIFERGFSRKEGATRGLGLHWIANTLGRMGGRIEAESKGPGQGAVFHLFLPTFAEAAEAA